MFLGGFVVIVWSGCAFIRRLRFIICDRKSQALYYLIKRARLSYFLGGNTKSENLYLEYI